MVSCSVPRRPDDDERTVITVLKPSAQKRSEAASGEACLVMIYGPELGRRIPLQRASAMEIGRHPSNDFPLDQESVSRRHARIVWADQHWHAVDLGSTNGTYVNDEIVTDRILRDGDQIKVGRTILKFLEGGSVETSYHEEIYRLMTFDGLTGAHNKRFFHEALEREVSRCKRYTRNLSLILFDIDHFKKVNDTYGHIAGDAVLRQLAALVRVNLRREDIFSRVGGEEFAIIVPETPPGDAQAVAEKIRALVEVTEMLFDTIAIPVTISLGVAGLDPNESSEALYAKADGFLYRAKQSGRNRVVS